MLYLVGLGLGDAKDITIKGLEIVKAVDKVYLENYTSILCCGHDELEKIYGRTITTVDRDMMEHGCQEMLDTAEASDAAVLVVGDPLNATTHTDLILRASQRKIPYRVVHNASILNAVACCGLQIYTFGETVSIPFWTETWKPESFYDKILRNKGNNLHTLCLLDIKVKEPNLDLLMKGVTKMEPPRFMSVSQAAAQLLAIVENRKSNKGSDNAIPFLDDDIEGHVKVELVCNSETQTMSADLSEKQVIIGLARIGSDTQRIVKTTLIEAVDLDLGPPLHSLVIPGSVHPIEEEMIELFASVN